MYAAERQQAMTQLVRERGRISVVELAQQYDVTTETVRRDLSVLEDRNLVRRVHGGAVPADALTLIEAGLPDRDVSRIEQKQRIASAALDLLPRADSTVILDAGSTTVRLARLLPPNLRMTRGHPRGADRRAAGGLAADRAAPAAGTRPPPHPRGSRSGDDRGAGRGPRRPRLRRDQRHHRRARPVHPRPHARPPSSAPSSSARGGSSCSPTPARSGSSARSSSPSWPTFDTLVTDKEIATSDRRSIEKAGVEVIAV